MSVTSQVGPVSGGRPPVALYSALSIGIVLALFVPMWLLGLPGDMFSPLGPTAIAALAGVRLAWLIGGGTRRVHEMVGWVFVYLFLGVAPLAQRGLEVSPSTTPWVQWVDVGTASAIVVAGCLAWVGGSFVGTHTRRETTERDSGEVSPSRTLKLMLVMLVIAAYYVASLGVDALFMSRSARFQVMTGTWTNSTVAAIVSSVATMGLLVTYLAMIRLKKQGERAPWLGMRWVVLISLLSVANPISTARYGFGTVVLAIAAAMGAYATQRRFRVFALAMLAGLVIVFPAADAFRRSTDATVQLEDPLLSLTSGDFDAFAQIVNSVGVVAEAGVAAGRQLLGVVFFWVPRSVWPGKAVDTGSMIAEHMGYRYTNLSAPLWSEFYINFGWVGLILGFVGLGYVLARLDLRAEANLRAVGSPSLLGAILPFYLLILLRGSLLQAMSSLAVLVTASLYVTVRGSLRTTVNHLAGLPPAGDARVVQHRTRSPSRREGRRSSTVAHHNAGLDRL